MKFKIAFSTLALTMQLSSSLPVEATNPGSKLDASFVKEVRRLMNNPAIMAAANQYGGSATSTLGGNLFAARNNNEENKSRVLQDKSYEVIEHDKLRCFYKCVEDEMTTEECIAYIETTIGNDLTLHEIKELQLKVNSPRPISWVEKTFWMVGIPTNIYGEVDCGIHEGFITYPWDWTVYDNAGGSTIYALPQVDCRGMNADDCCNKIMSEYDAAGIPLEDGQGNCLSCWVHQEPLEPVLAAGESAGGTVEYLEQVWDSTTGTCQEIPLPEADVVAADDVVKSQVPIVQSEIQSVIDLGEGATVPCSNMIALFEELLFFGRAFPRAMSQIPSLLCGECDNPTDGLTLTEELMAILTFIKNELIVESLDSVENCIIIYEDRQGKVMEPPKIGGSREVLDYDRDDPDCVDVAPISCPPGQTPMPDGTGCMPEGNSCPPGQTPMPDGSGCMPEGSDCIAPQTLVNGVCECPEPYVNGDVTADEPLCICPEGQVMLTTGGCGPMGTDGSCGEGLEWNPKTQTCWNSCGCGYCAPIKASKGGDGMEESTCCSMNAAGNNCRPPNDVETNECGRQNFIFTYNDGDNGNVCSGVEISSTSRQRGCGCQPSRTHSCEFDQFVESDVCLHCSFINLDNGDEACDDCAACLNEHCDSPSNKCVAGESGNFQQCVDEDAASDSVTRYRNLMMRGLQKNNKEKVTGKPVSDETENPKEEATSDATDGGADKTENTKGKPTTDDTATRFGHSQSTCVNMCKERCERK